MEPAAELQMQEQNDFAKKVNEMQKFLPCLEQRIENATLQNVKDEELEKWKLLRQVLCDGQQVAAMSDSLTLEDLDKYTLMLRDSENVPTKATTTNTLDNDKECSKENITSNENSTELDSKKQKKIAETDEEIDTSTISKEDRKVSENQGNKQLPANEEKQDKCDNVKEVQSKDEDSTKHLNGNLETVTSDVSNESNTLSKEHIIATPDAAKGKTRLEDSADKNENDDTAKEALQENDNEDMEEEEPKNNEKVQQADNDEAQQIEEDIEPPDDLEEIEYEGVELIKIPDETAEDEMILPDSADEADFTMHDSGGEEEEAEEEQEEEELQQEMGEKQDEQQIEEQDEEEQQAEQENAEEQQMNRDEEDPIKGVEKEQQVEKVDKEQLEKEEDDDDEDDDKDEGGEDDSNEKTNDKAVPASNTDIEASRDSVESASVHYQEENTHTSDSNSRKDTDDDEPKSANENENAAADTTSDTEEVEAIEETSTQQHEIDDGDSNSLTAEHTLNMDSHSGPAQEPNTDCDDPLGQAADEVESQPKNGASTTSKASDRGVDEEQNSEEVTEGGKSTPKPNEQPNDDDDDDDVEIIESRNSPICLDTDDDDEQAGNELNKTTTTRKTIDLRSAKTSTRTIVQANKRTTETIDLLDSSDEEGSRNNKRMYSKRATNARYTLTKSLVKMPTTTTHQATRGRKRTLLPAVQTHKPLKISQVMSGAAVPINCRAFNTTTSKTQPTKSPKSVLLFPPTSFKPTPQSNFLNAVNLLPTAATTGDNPLAFSATLSNKNIIIPNAFYANRRTTAKEADVNTAGKEGKEATSTTTSSTSVPSSQAAATSSSSAMTASKTAPKVQTITVTQQQERVYREWLDEFIENFANPQQIATHSCLVLLQSALKYKSFARIKDLRTALNTKALTSNSIADGQLTRELHNSFYTTDCRLTSEGFRFCAAACSQNGSNVTLMTDARTGRSTVRTCPYDELSAKYSLIVNGGAGGSGGGGGGATFDDKRVKRFKGDGEYTPAKYYEKKVDAPKSGERRKSLRQHRTRCYDETYLYEPVEGELEDEPLPNVINRKSGGVVSSKSRQEAQMMDLVQRKAEEKRLEAKRQREQQVKSFESAYLEMFANTLRGPKPGKKTKESWLAATESSDSATSSRHSTDAAAQIVIDDDEDQACFEDDEPRSHRIYKVVPTNLIAAPRYPAGQNDDDDEEPENIYGDEDTMPTTTTTKKGGSSKRGRPRKQNLTNLKKQNTSNEPELITCDSTSGESINGDNNEQQNADADAEDQNVPKNVNKNWHASTDWCRICNKRIPRTVAHYVNEHPKNEVYTSRIQKDHLTRIRKEGGQILQMRPYLNGQEQYAAECAFCNKTCCFKLSYWYQHYSMHTGEYAYRCSGCNVRKPTRSAMTVHINQPCRKRGQLLEEYTYNPRSKYIEVRVCKLCNYTQLNQRNVWKHLRTQHGVKHAQKKNIEGIILLRMPEPEVDEMLEDAQEFMDLSSGGGDSNQMAMTFNYDNFNDVAGHLGGVAGGMWDEGDPTDDLSYMICGMLDVEMRNDAE